LSPAVLVTLNDRITDAIAKLPPVDPLTLSTRSPGGDGEGKIREIIREQCRDFDSHLSRRMTAEYFGCGPLEPLMDIPDVTEIIVNGPEAIWVERAGRLQRHPDRFLSQLTFRNFIARLSRESGMQASLDSPFADGYWRGCRVHLLIPPAAHEQAVITLRRHSISPWDFRRLAESDWACRDGLETLKELVSQRRNFLIVGGTGSGKTSVLNACLMAIPESERALLIEDTSELRLPNEASSKLLTRRDPHGNLKEVNQSELVRQALRMRPDRIVMGEIRGGEAKDLLMAFASGHSGCIGTLHAESARQALIRLEMLIQIGAPQWGLQAVRTLIRLSLHSVVVVKRRKSDGARVLDGIYAIASLEDEAGFLLEKTI
jgi:pilus assembly protein CpaF